jgi:hypothetical protein
MSSLFSDPVGEGVVLFLPGKLLNWTPQAIQLPVATSSVQ